MFSHMSLNIYLHVQQKEDLNFNDSRGFSGGRTKLIQEEEKVDFERLKGAEMPFK